MDPFGTCLATFVRRFIAPGLPMSLLIAILLNARMTSFPAPVM